MEYFQNMDFNKVIDNKMFWETEKPKFSNKYKHNYFDRRDYDYKN